MMASAEGCIVETCADSTKQPKVECGMFVGLSLCSTGGNEPKMSSCKLPGAPQDVSPKSLSSFTDTLSMMETIPVFKSHKRQRSDAMVEISPALDSFLVRQNSSVVDSQRAGPLMDPAEEMCKPRPVYPVNFKAPKMHSSPQSGRSRDLEIPIGGGSGAGEWSQLRSPSDPSYLSNFNVGFFNKGNFPASNTVSDHRRLSRHRSRANSYHNNNNGSVNEQEGAPSEDGDHSQISIDLERISLAATSFSPFTSPRPTLRPSPLLPVVFSPIQPVAYRRFGAGVTEGAGAMKEEEEEDQELVINLPTEEIHASTCGAVPSLNSHTHHNHLQQQEQEHYLYKLNNYHSHPSSFVHIVTLPHNKITPPSTYEEVYTHGGMRADPMVVEASELLDEDMLIFNMDA